MHGLGQVAVNHRRIECLSPFQLKSDGQLTLPESAKERLGGEMAA